MARPTATSAFWISRLRSATRNCSARTRCWTRAWASTAPRPASTTCRSATPPFSNIPGLPTGNPVVAGGLPSIGITGFTGFGRQSTNPQWQNPALIDPKVNFTWVKGKPLAEVRLRVRAHLDGGERQQSAVWLVHLRRRLQPLQRSGRHARPAIRHSDRRDTYWADFLFGTTSAYSLANYFVAHLRQNTAQRLCAGRLEGAART